MIICTIAHGACAPYAELTNDNRRQYCNAHGYQFLFSNQLLFDKADSPIQNACWSKLVLMHDIMSNYATDYVCWMDNDMWIFNMDLDIMSQLTGKYSLFTSHDAQGLNLGVMAMPSCKESQLLLKDWLSREKWLNHKWSESMAVNEWYNEGTNKDRVKLVDRQFWNTFLHEKQGKCNVLHLAGETTAARHEYFRQCKNGLIT